MMDAEITEITQLRTQSPKQRIVMPSAPRQANADASAQVAVLRVEVNRVLRENGSAASGPPNAAPASCFPQPLQRGVKREEATVYICY